MLTENDLKINDVYRIRSGVFVKIVDNKQDNLILVCCQKNGAKIYRNYTSTHKIEDFVRNINNGTYQYIGEATENILVCETYTRKLGVLKSKRTRLLNRMKKIQEQVDKLEKDPIMIAEEN